jgi:hypothetical protein
VAPLVHMWLRHIYIYIYIYCESVRERERLPEIPEVRESCRRERGAQDRRT